MAESGEGCSQGKPGAVSGRRRSRNIRGYCSLCPGPGHGGGSHRNCQPQEACGSSPTAGLPTHDGPGAALGLLTPGLGPSHCLPAHAGTVWPWAEAPTSPAHSISDRTVSVSGAGPARIPRALAEYKLSMTCQLAALLDPVRRARSTRRSRQPLPGAGPGISGEVDIIPHAHSRQP